MFENLEDVTDTVGLVWKFDKSDGNPDSTVFGNWISIAGDDTTYRNKVWVINRGIDALGNVLGLKKIKFNRLIGGKYFLRSLIWIIAVRLMILLKRIICITTHNIHLLMKI